MSIKVIVALVLVIVAAMMIGSGIHVDTVNFNFVTESRINEGN